MNDTPAQRKHMGANPDNANTIDTRQRASASINRALRIAGRANNWDDAAEVAETIMQHLAASGLEVTRRNAS
jgi:hypothetical protein